MVCNNFWAEKRVFITGHTGFKGSWLSLWLKSMGADVRGYALAPPTKPSLFEEIELNKRISTEFGDVRDVEHLYQSMRDFNPEIVFHLAAQSLVRLSYETPLETYSTNLMGIVALLESVRKLKGIKVVINVTSDKCYENQEWVWGYRESEPMGGYDPYSCSKGCSELITASYRRSFFSVETFKEHGCALASVRAGNVIGGGDWSYDRLLPDILKAFSTQQKVIIRSPKAVRPWQHVLDPLSGYLMLAERLYTDGPAFAEGWNFGPNDESSQSVEWILTCIARLWGDTAEWQFNPTVGVHEANVLKLDCSKARFQLGWQPLLGLEPALSRTINWYKAWVAGKNMYDYTLTEISDYMTLWDSL